ncbi:UNVERIFIED_CONTAM: hypothetical protein GTU68_033457 [Idotea baltica]|nr:hypothetical protein [Idotea baltica]
MTNKADLNVEVGGHTDGTGNFDNNMKLSNDRAYAVQEYLVAHGVDKARLKHNGFGPSRPVATNETDEGRQQNRRTEIEVQ